MRGIQPFQKWLHCIDGTQKSGKLTSGGKGSLSHSKSFIHVWYIYRFFMVNVGKYTIHGFYMEFIYKVLAPSKRWFSRRISGCHPTALAVAEGLVGGWSRVINEADDFF